MYKKDILSEIWENSKIMRLVLIAFLIFVLYIQKSAY